MKRITIVSISSFRISEIRSDAALVTRLRRDARSGPHCVSRSYHATSHTSPMGIDDHDTFTGLTQLQAAAADGNVDKVVELLDAGADADIQANGEVRQDALFANGDATRVRRPGGSIGTPSRQDPRSRRRRGSSHLDRVDRSPRVSRDPAPRSASRRRVATDYARAFVGRRALFPDTFPPGASPRRPARVPDLTSRLTNPPHANHSTCSRFAELRQDRRDDRRLERLHRDPQSDGARSFAAEPEGCGRRHRRHVRRRAQAQLRARLRTSPTRSDGPFPHAASSPSPDPAASPRSHPR